MRLPLSILKSFIHIDLSPEKIDETLSLLGIEVDAIHSPKPPFQGVVVAEVKKTSRHPGADKLQVAEVFDGIHTYQVVCGAPNCRTGLKVAFAKVGAVLGEEKSIGQTSIRGVDSAGMLCSATELGLYEDHSGIIELPEDAVLGADCLSLWDPVFEISLTPNLGHCMSALGIARELSAALQIPLREEKKALQETGSSLKLSVETDPMACPRYTARMIEEVKIGPSPFWLQQQLRAAGHRPINNIVDATNYMLLKYGQPMHAFDFDKIEGSLHVALSKEPQMFAGLDGKDWTVPAGTLTIADNKKTLALAGVLGGSNSSVSDTTKTILLEAAAFDPMVVRKAAKKIGIRTDSSYRFEKGVDPSAVPTFLDHAAQLIAEISGGKVAKGKIDIKREEFAPRILHCRTARVNQVLGTHLSLGEMEAIFHRLGFHTKKESAAHLRVEVPLYRNDVQEEIDLVEEVARIYGYNNIERPLPRSTLPQIPHDPVYLFESELRKRLVGLGLQEFITCDLISPKLAETIQELSHFKSSLLQTLHSKSEEYSVLRPALLPGLLDVVRHNLDQKNQNFSAFELGRIHFKQEGKPVEFPMVALILTGKEAPHHWDEKPSDVDFFDLKGMIENLFSSIRASAASFAPSKHMTFHPVRQADVYFGDLCIGCFGELHPNLLAKFDIKQRVYYAELNAEHLQAHQKPAPHMTPLPQFPSSERDWTLPLAHDSHIATIFGAIRAAEPQLLERFELIDLFRTEDKTNATLRFTYRDRSKTVSFEEVEAAHSSLITEVMKKTSMI